MYTGIFRFMLFAAVITTQAAATYHETSKDNRGTINHKAMDLDITNRVLFILSRDFEKCTELPKIYRFDCYRQTYGNASSVLQGSKDHLEAFTALSGLESTLDQLVHNNVDAAQQPIRRGNQTYRAIHRAAITTTQAQTEHAMQQAQTLLLRAPENKQLHYAFIAEAINSNKVLLRSAMLPGRMLRFASHWAQFSPTQRPLPKPMAARLTGTMPQV